MLLVGFAEVDITPAIGSLMGWFPVGPDRIPRRATGVHDRLKAKALAISDGSTTVCHCDCDVTLWQPRDIAAMREAITTQYGDLPAENVLITATHTHHSGENSYVCGGNWDDPWPVEARAKVAQAVGQALGDLTPARMSVGQVEAPYNFNRRAMDSDGKLIQSGCAWEYQEGVTEGVTDPTMTVLCFERTDAPNLLWANWTAHGVTVGFGSEQYTADYLGAMAAYAEERLDDTKVVCSNGAVGNMMPKWGMRSDFEAYEKLTPLLSEKLLGARLAAHPVAVESIGFAGKTLTYTNRLDASLTVLPEISCLKIGSFVVGFMPGDVYVEFQLEFCRVLGRDSAMMVGYTHGFVGYVPTSESFEDGGYGVDLHTVFEPQYSMTQLPRGAGEEMLKVLIALAEGL